MPEEWDDESEARYQALVQAEPEEESLSERRLNENRNMNRMYKKWRSFIK